MNDALYPIRVACGLTVLVAYRRRYLALAC